MWVQTHEEAPRSLFHLAGLVGPGIAEVRLAAEGKPPIVATVMSGWFAAWLHDDYPLITIRGYDADGVEVATLAF